MRKAALGALLLSTMGFVLASCGNGSSGADSDPSSMAPPPAGSTAALSYALMDAGDGASAFNTFLALSTVDGIAIRTSWQSLEPTKGSFDWSAIDAAVSAATTYGKKITLHVLASAYASPPSWVYTDGAQSYTYATPTGTTKTDPVPWDSIFLARWETFVSALASHLTASGGLARIQYVSVAVPVPEMSLVGCTNGLLGGTLAYSRANYLDAWRRTVLATQTAFPSVAKLLPVPVSMICRPDNDGPRFYHDLFEYVLSLGATGFSHYATDLNALGSARMNGIVADSNRAAVGLQFIWSATDDPSNRMQGTLRDAICSGLKTYRSQYFEVYKADLQNPDPNIQGAIEAIHSPALCP
jgi:hypothetical protein